MWEERPPEVFRLRHFVVWFTLSVLYWRGASTLQQDDHGKICNSVDLRNTVDSLKLLEGCRVVEGFVQVILFDHTNETEFENVTFPELREITCYLLLYRVKGLRSLGQLFPNLAVIRGNQLFNDYALVVYEMFQLQEIGLWGLTSIERGDVRIEKNPNLCFVDTIDWNLIAVGEREIVQNKDKSRCGSSTVCSQSGCERSLCWGSGHCQKLRQDGCHEMCLGGCTGPGPRHCAVCKHVLVDGECVDTCPNNSYNYLSRRCVSADECRKMQNHHMVNNRLPDQLALEDSPLTSWTFNHSCVQQCPSGFEKQNGDGGSTTCVECRGRCRHECTGIKVDSIAAAQNLRGCTLINGSLEIQILRGKHIYKELESSLNMIEEIYGYLKVARSFPLISLNFLKNLKVIHGNKLDNNKYALVVINNENLQELWDWESRPERKFEIKHGRLFFHFNPKLCRSHIDKLQELAGLSNYTNLEVARESNGDKVACNVINLHTKVSIKQPTSVVIEWEPCVVPEPSSLLGYVVYYIEAPFKNATAYDGREVCGDNGWQMKDVTVPDDDDNSTSAPRNMNYILTHLKPFTQYAFYILTYSVTSTGGQSYIEYFTTLPDRPSLPMTFTGGSNKSSEIRLEWKPPQYPNGILSHYIVSGTRLADDKQYLGDRDYCKFPLRPKQDDASELHLPPLPKPVTQSNSSWECEQLLKPKVIESREDYEELCRSFIAGQPVQRENSDWDVACGQYIYTFLHTALPNQKLLYNDEDRVKDTSYMSGENKFPLTISRSWPTWGHSVSPNDTVTNEGVYERFYRLVNANLTSLMLTDLRYFSKYTVQLIACRQHETEEHNRPMNDISCSFATLITLRTRALPSADLINSSYVTVDILNRSAGAVHLQWKEPPSPNGFVVSYHVEFRRTDIEHFKPKLECVTRKQYEMGEGGYILKNLQPGNYGFRIRANSLSDLGPFTDMVHLEIEELAKDVSPQTVIGAVLGSVVILTCIVGLILYWRKYNATKAMKLFATVNPDYIGSLGSAYVEDEWEVPRDRLDLLRELGQGSFGMVYEGILRPTKIRCAVKMVNESASARERMEFLNEASVMKSFAGAHHIVRLLGVVSRGEPPLVIMELMARGDMKSFLRAARDSPSEQPGLPRTLRMAAEIADGMAYLEANKFVHRDLAARNCMVAEDLTVKIGDFGMTRDIYETDYYRNGTKGLLPVRWMAPESLADGVFSSQSDVWSFGVVLWEMATLAEQPYQGLANEQVLQFVLAAGVLERPQECTDFLHDLMLTCWEWRPSERPTFLQLLAKLEDTAKLSPLFRKLSFYHSSAGQELKATRKPGEGVYTAACAPHVNFYHTEDGKDLAAHWTKQSTLRETESLLKHGSEGLQLRHSKKKDSIPNNQSEYVESNTMLPDRNGDSQNSSKSKVPNGGANGYVYRPVS